jgi:hypothetical protein
VGGRKCGRREACARAGAGDEICELAHQDFVEIIGEVIVEVVRNDTITFSARRTQKSERAIDWSRPSQSVRSTYDRTI